MTLLSTLAAMLVCGQGCKKDERSAEFLGTFSDEINKTLPRAVDKETELTSTSAAEGVFTYNHRLVNVASSNIDAKGIIEAVRPNLKNSACSTPGTRKILDRGIKLRYSYSDKSGHPIGDVEMTRADCEH